MSAPRSGAEAIDGSPERHGLSRQWLDLELGAARSLRRHYGVVRDSPPRNQGRRSLVLQAAHSLLPEAGVEDLPAYAREEVEAGMSGPLRQRIAATEAQAGLLDPLRDQLVAQISGRTPQQGAIVVVDQVHLRRLVRREVPAIVSVRCLSWYGAYRHADDAHAEDIALLIELGQEWLHRPTRRAELSARIMERAESLVGRFPTTLIDDEI